MLVATVLSMGATGISMLLIAAPFLLARETPRVGVTVAIAAVVALTAVYMLERSTSPHLSRGRATQRRQQRRGTADAPSVSVRHIAV